MSIQLTTITTTIGVITMLTAWYVVRVRAGQSHAPMPRQIELLDRHFLYMATFFTLMTLPSVWLYLDPTRFPLYMAWGYVVGHIFLYLAFINVGRLVFSITPRLANKDWLVLLVGGAITTAITIFNAVTMIWGRQPAYDYGHLVTQFNAHPLVGATIGLMGALTFLPAGVLFLRNAARSQGGRRTRSLLLGVGFILMVVAGPPHDIAGTWQLYLFGDIIAITSILLVGTGVLYRFEESLTPEPRPVPAPAAN
jgi:hypothetical protein